MKLLPDKVVTMQVLRFNPGTDIQSRRSRENGIGPQLCRVRVVVWHRYGSQEVVDDLQQVGLLEPDLSRSYTAAEQKRASSRFSGKRA